MNKDFNNFPPLSNLKQELAELPSNMDHVGPSQAQPQVEPIVDGEGFRSTAEWQLDASRLFGEVRDGVPPSFTPAETEFMFVEGAKNKVRYNPPLEQNRRPINSRGLHDGALNNVSKHFKSLFAPSGDTEGSPLILILLPGLGNT